MTDIDFDELDKAVNSMLTPSDGGQNNNSDDGVLKVDENLPNPLIQAQSEPIVANESTMRPPSRPLVNNPRTGRFMDVVPPNANTRVNIAPADNVSRQGVSVDTEQSSDNAQTNVQPETVEPTPTAEPVNQWPDPINLAEIDNQSNNQLDDLDSEDADIDQISNDINETMAAGASEESNDTPFLAGTKVEKRPLGAFSETNNAESNNESTESNDDHGYADTIAVESAVPEEMSLITAGEPEKMIESNIASEPEVVAAAPETVAPEAPVAPSEVVNMPESVLTPVISVEAPAPAPDAAPAMTPEVKPEATQPAAPVSINQQYQEKPSTGDQTSGAIYDTNSYHKAVLQPVKKKSGWLMVIWILLLVIVGAGSGVLVYNFVLPNL